MISAERRPQVLRPDDNVEKNWVCVIMDSSKECQILFSYYGGVFFYLIEKKVIGFYLFYGSNFNSFRDDAMNGIKYNVNSK